MKPGEMLGSYQVLEKLGEGGMGEVYRARDAKLNRDVAIKILPDALAADSAALARFEREAQAVAALSHPNILAIHDFGRQGETAYAVMELLEGETLRARLEHGALPARKAAEFATQIAEGLAAAHEKGIVHRDLKPENIFLTEDGRAKILDFGVAKRAGAAGESGANVETILAHTGPGTVLGTVGYMSPEQVRGELVDQRSDIFAFGVVLYEMLTGRRAFGRESAADTMSAILKEDPPDLATTASGASPSLALQRIVQHCLEKKPGERFQSARDVAFALGAFSGTERSSGASAVAAAQPRRRWLRPTILVAVVAAALALGVAFGRWISGEGPVAPPTFTLRSFERHAIFNARFGPDGRTIFFDAALTGNQPQIFKLNPDSALPQKLGSPGTHLLSVSSKGQLAVLTDVRYLTFRLFSGTLAKMTTEGQTKPWMDDVREADWGPDGDTVAIVHVVGSTDKLEYPEGRVRYQTQGYLSDLRVSPDGSRVAFMEHPWKWDDRGYVKIVDRSGGPPTTLTGEFWGEQGLAWSRDGTTVYFSATAVAMGDYLPWAVSSSGRRAPRQVLSGAGSLYVQDIAGADGHGQWLVTRQDWSQSIRALIPGATEEREFSWGNNALNPTLSRDGKTLLFEDANSEAGRNYRIGVRLTDGSPAVPLGDGVPCGFSPDERWVLALVYSPLRLVRYPIGVGAPVPVDHGPLERVSSAGWIDETRVWICGNEKGRAARCYQQNITGGPLKTLTPEGLDVALVSPDGKLVAVSSGALDSATRIMPSTGGDPRPVRGLLAGDRVGAWTRDSKALLVRTADLPAQLDRLDPVAGTRTHLRSLAPPDRAGVTDLGVTSVLDDGRSYAYGYRRDLSTLYVVTGCRWETMNAPCR